MLLASQDTKENEKNLRYGVTGEECTDQQLKVAFSH